MQQDQIPDSAIANLPVGQISDIECKMLYYMASEIWSGRGAIVELGSLYGKSTVCLARGMKANTRECVGKLHAYDKWRVDDENKFMLGQLKTGFSGSFRNIFDENVKEFADVIVPHEGDVFDAQWTGGPIEILFIDCSISLAFHEMVFKKFYPFLEKGSIVIHQDYFLYRSYYLPLMMGKLFKYLQEKGNADTSVIFQCCEKIPTEMFNSPLVTSDTDITWSLEIMVAAYGGPSTVCGGIIASMLVYFYNMRGHYAQASAWTRKISSKDHAVQRNLRNAMVAA